MKCCVCQNDIPAFKGKKYKFGGVCENCLSYLPQNIDINNFHIFQINRIIDWNKQYLKTYKKQFEETCCYGDLHIDDVHGLFAIYPKKYTQIPSNCTDIFNILSVKDFSISMKQSGVSNQNKAYGSAYFVCELNDLNIIIRKNIAPKIVCFIENVDSTHYRVKEPSDLSLIRSTFFQSINNAIYKYNQNFRDDVVSKESMDLFRAKVLFMVGDVYSLEEIKKNKSRLLKAFSNDEDDGEVYSFIIKNAYKILKDHLPEEVIDEI